MKNRVWMLVLVVLCGSAAALSAFAHPAAGEFYAASEEEISNDEATKDKMDAVEAAEICENDCVKDETATCNALHDPVSHSILRKCLRNVPALCERKCN